MPSILIIEDDELLLRMYESIFDEHHYQVCAVSNGAAALAQLAEVRPAAILLDIVMPKLDGLTLLKQLRADPATKTIPVVVITSLTDTATAEAAMAAGANRFIQKSEHRPVAIVEIVNNLLRATVGRHKEDRD